MYWRERHIGRGSTCVGNGNVVAHGSACHVSSTWMRFHVGYVLARRFRQCLAISKCALAGNSREVCCVRIICRHADRFIRQSEYIRQSEIRNTECSTVHDTVDIGHSYDGSTFDKRNIGQIFQYRSNIPISVKFPISVKYSNIGPVSISIRYFNIGPIYRYCTQISV